MKRYAIIDLDECQLLAIVSDEATADVYSTWAVKRLNHCISTNLIDDDDQRIIVNGILGLDEEV